MPKQRILSIYSYDINLVAGALGGRDDIILLSGETLNWVTV